MKEVQIGPCRLINADCRDALACLDGNSIDTIITDPPYGLSFMGKEWDHGVPGVQFWEAALRVAKPGAILMAFGGTRTFHRLACAIEDAGWELRDTIMWVYGCLSEDSEVLTRDGWQRYDLAVNGEILAYDHEADVYKWEKPSRWSTYYVEQDTAYRISSNSTDQIVSRGHRCIVERDGELSFVASEELSGMERVPTLPDCFCGVPKAESALLQQEVQRILSRDGMEDSRQEGESWLDRGESPVMSRENEWREESIMEGRSDVHEPQGSVCDAANKIRSLPDGVCGDGSQGWLRDGASLGRSNGDRASIDAKGVCSPHQPQCHGQQVRELDAVCDKLGPQEVRGGTSYQTTLATVTPIEYSGMIFCPTVSTGAFVARRNGKVFITGNSGFPKSLDISKAIDKAAGAEREVIGIKEGREGGWHHSSTINDDGWRGGEQNITAPATEAASKWSGYGTALKPAWEPIIVAMKPLDGTFAENAMKHGLAGLHIDGGRIEIDPSIDDPRLGGNGTWSTENAAKNVYEGGYAGIRTGSHAFGRFPANLIHDGSDDVMAGFPEANSARSSGNPNNPKRGTNHMASSYGQGDGKVTHDFRDKGSAARFFYCAKASSSERGNFNTHPTVKPLALMEYLCKLTKTPTGGTVLDMFMGSGSTGVACVNTGRSFIGIEREDSPEQPFFTITSQRIENAVNGPVVVQKNPDPVDARPRRPVTADLFGDDE